MTPAVAADLAEVDAFLSAHVTCAMFPLTNLREYGLSGDAAQRQDLWLTRQGGQVTDVLTLNHAGLVLPLLPSASYDRYVAANSHVVLMDGTQPLAMCGFNARLPKIVQVGGVYTPLALRGQGHARRAIGQQLAQARAAGVQRAVLFAASDTAASTYRALGFEQIGLWTLLLLTNAQVVHA